MRSITGEVAKAWKQAATWRDGSVVIMRHKRGQRRALQPLTASSSILIVVAVTELFLIVWKEACCCYFLDMGVGTEKGR